MNVLVIAAHPDDEVLGAGGAIARHAEEGDRVALLILGTGVAARAGLAEADIAQQQRKLRDAAQSAAAHLGALEPTICSFPDNQFDTVALLSIVREVEAVMEASKPDIVYTHHAGDVNVDHRTVSQAVEAATRPMEGNSVREVRAFEVPSSSEWNFTRAPFRPNVFLALTDVQLKKKIDAMKTYNSEIRAFPHPRSPEYLEALARVRGGQSGYRAAEAFELVYARR